MVGCTVGLLHACFLPLIKFVICPAFYYSHSVSLTAGVAVASRVSVLCLNSPQGASLLPPERGEAGVTALSQAGFARVMCTRAAEYATSCYRLYYALRVAASAAAEGTVSSHSSLVLTLCGARCACMDLGAACQALSPW